MSDTTTNEPANPGEKENSEKIDVRNELSPGAQLSSRREALHWSIEQVASQLNLAPRQIQAIEADNYAALPGMASTRGFIRSYAKLLNVDATPLLQVVAKETTAIEESMPLRRALPSIRLPENRLSPPGGHRFFSRSTVVVLIFALLAAGVFVLQKMGMISGITAFLQSGAVNRATVNVPLAPVDTAAQDAPASAGEVEPAAEYAAVVAPDSMGPEKSEKRDTGINPAAPKVALSAESTPDGKASAPTVAASVGGAKDMLILKMREESWVEIKRPDDSVLVSALLAAGTTETVKINGPVTMTIGNAGGVDATFGGKSLELKAGARSNVARLNLK